MGNAVSTDLGGGFVDILVDHAASTFVLVGHQLQGMLSFFFGVFVKLLGKAMKSDVVTIKKSSL